MNFTKTQGLGNDFILIDTRREKLDGIDLKRLAIDLCDRHFGIGADGLLLVWPSSKAHYRMQVINPDGSEAEMCGNGIRCFARYVYETDKLSEEVISVETLAGTLLPAIIKENGLISGVEVDMGQPKNEGPVTLNGFQFQKISMGNPHAVTFVENLTEIDLANVGPEIENDPHFPNRTNVEFVKVISNKEIEVRVWERGAGETLACGTGACAALAAANLAGKTGRRAIIRLPGGNLDIEWGEDNHLLMRGPAEKVFEGSYSRE
ncbi:diaminopimelate epimerase [candidate division WOR-1 bacterium RIFOXYA12_FULL_52_29]|uniref:Diaminopimelate epimerase n=1 Tax=candidate division WOR-1 bacterium RIFOXYC12_FULL_54_18 TaxID=1802584 RepID=A0A1F4T8R9_UNCSA|nr:MAG: diaminopimelate epimerase [candidate division WOR-1 bacterium RIFOXYA2_FULL_51_19]OGC18502.1 MAG: diaminopimelate epimerase [candidate division WOR-1 bacterium RIFOXYA12_FULL_52_29]OGC27360.1 MAG: diaminopimelate epimerase [candidate division WOR-1 bacterium RIFOXYB2_FULL_45_9]OGC28919.1 MAG: diaminopimelate epimerase [candidate division WOR-1 bacterium RIFOXYC12_FULL_54_18]OGC31322.1 MAG: diaminopimelate epimerase [candidate division WOR-1 bacterium RIFOXYB12_FULL_52_16]